LLIKLADEDLLVLTAGRQHPSYFVVGQQPDRVRVVADRLDSIEGRGAPYDREVVGASGHDVSVRVDIHKSVDGVRVGLYVLQLFETLVVENHETPVLKSAG